MAKLPLPPQDYILKLMKYEPDTGRLFWKVRTPDMFAPGNIGQEAAARGWNKRWAGKEAFTAHHHYYLTGNLNNSVVRAHRVIWKMMTGEDPNVVDHINGDGKDNRWTNLRQGTVADNSRNTARRRDNASGAAGVFWCPHVRRWRGRLTVNKRNLHLGYFNCLGHAIAARRKAQAAHGFSRRHGALLVGDNGAR